MPAVKQQVIQMIQSLPEEVTVDDIIAELYFKLQVDAGLKELDEGKGIPHEEIEKRMSKWLTVLSPPLEIHLEKKRTRRLGFDTRTSRRGGRPGASGRFGGFVRDPKVMC